MLMLNLPSDVKEVIDRLYDNGYEAFAVGGCIRDMLIGRKIYDYDITTSAKPEEVISVFSDKKTIPTGIKHGTVTLLNGKRELEITTYRVDVGYSDARHPDNVRFTPDLKEDLARRDFTVNAMAYNDRVGLIDVFGGKEDLDNKIIRTVGDAELRFSEDGLRILRAMRFASTLGFEIEEKTKKAIHEKRELLNNISGERKRDETLKLILGDYAEDVLYEFADVIDVYIPGFLKMRGFEQRTPYHKYDVLRHTLRALVSSEKDPKIRLTVLLHDIGKPEVFTLDENGRGHFHFHAPKGAEMAAPILDDFHLDRDTYDEIIKLIALHREKIELSEKSVKHYIAKHGYAFLYDMLEVKRADNSGKGVDVSERMAGFDFIEKTAEKLEEDEKCLKISQLEINGNDLINLGLKGKRIGEVLDALLFAVIDEEVENVKEAEINYVKEKLL